MQLQGTNTYILGTGAERLLIDSGQGRARWEQLMASLAAEHKFRISTVLLTHWHLDHTGGVPHLFRIFPELRGANAIYKYHPDPSQQAIVDGQVFSVEGATVRAVFTPGHSTDHMCFLLQEEEAIFTGDTVLGHGTTGVEDLEEYMQSLRKIQSLGCRIGYPGHGAVIENMQQKVQQEIDRKQRRERQVLLALQNIQREKRTVGDANGAATQAELIEAIFGRLPADVADRFFAPYMEDILMKMARDKQVGFRFKGGQKHWFANVSQENPVCR